MKTLFLISFLCNYSNVSMILSDCCSIHSLLLFLLCDLRKLMYNLYFTVLFLQPVNVEGIVMYVSNREQITTKNTGLCPIRRITLRDRTGAHRLFSLWRENADIPSVLQATVASTVLVLTDVTYNPDQGYSSSKTRCSFASLFESTRIAT